MHRFPRNGLSALSVAMSVPRVREEENHLAKFSSIGGSQKVIHDSNRLYRQSSTTKCLHKQGIITAQIGHITRKVKQTNGRENVMIHKYEVYIFPKGKQRTIHTTKLYWQRVKG